MKDSAHRAGGRRYAPSGPSLLLWAGASQTMRNRPRFQVNLRPKPGLWMRITLPFNYLAPTTELAECAKRAGFSAETSTLFAHSRIGGGGFTTPTVRALGCRTSQASVAQGIEHRSPKAGVGSSILPRRTLPVVLRSAPALNQTVALFARKQARGPIGEDRWTPSEDVTGRPAPAFVLQSTFCFSGR